MRPHVLDSSALMALYEDRNGAAKVESILNAAAQGGLDLTMSTVNWGEVYYSAWRISGPAKARERIAQLARLPLHLIPAGMEQAAAAAELRIGTKLPYADCFAAGLAIERKATLVTSDPDFEVLGRRVPILWIR